MQFAFQSGVLGRSYQAPIVYRAKASTVAGTGNLTKPAGVAVGDLVVVVEDSFDGTAGALSTASGGTWAISSVGSVTLGAHRYWWKVLDATDVANAWNTAASHNAMYAVAYDGRGATTLTVRDMVANGNGLSTLTVPGLVPNNDTKGLLVLYFERESTSSPVNPGILTVRESRGSGFRSIFSDVLGHYVGGDFVWTGTLGGSGGGEAAGIFEIT